MGVSVRTLHHWDAIGLVVPSGRTHADYRVYSADDVARIHQVLVFRELEIPLAEIGTLLDGPADGTDEAGASKRELSVLARQRAALVARISRLEEIVDAVDAIMKERTMGQNPTPEKRAELFGNEWAAEAEERWGGTPQWAQSQQRIGSMSEAEKARMVAEGEELNRQLADAKRSGAEPGSDEVNSLVERHREMVSAAYDCSHSMQVLLGRMYVADSRFTEYYETYEPGLAAWLSASIDANARANGVDPDTAEWR